MWGILQTVLISIIIITIGQYSFQYLKDTLTPRKTKDLVGFHKQKFDEIINELKEAKTMSKRDLESELLEFAQQQLRLEEDDNNIKEVI